MDPKTGKMYDSAEDAIADGKLRQDLIQLSWTDDDQAPGLQLAAQFGNRHTRRHRFEAKFQESVNPSAIISRSERDRRNAKRRVARKQRKRNRRAGK